MASTPRSLLRQPKHRHYHYDPIDEHDELQSRTGTKTVGAGGAHKPCRPADPRLVLHTYCSGTHPGNLGRQGSLGLTSTASLMIISDCTPRKSRKLDASDSKHCSHSMLQSSFLVQFADLPCSHKSLISSWLAQYAEVFLAHFCNAGTGPACIMMERYLPRRVFSFFASRLRSARRLGNIPAR
jgi:hypothetical protein